MIPMDVPNWMGKAHEASTLHKELQETKESREGKRWSPPLKSTHQLLPSAKCDHKPYIQVTLFQMSRIYLEIYRYVYTSIYARNKQLVKKEVLNLKKTGQGCMGELRGRKDKGEI